MTTNKENIANRVQALDINNQLSNDVLHDMVDKIYANEFPTLKPITYDDYANTLPFVEHYVQLQRTRNPNKMVEIYCGAMI